SQELWRAHRGGRREEGECTAEDAEKKASEGDGDCARSYAQQVRANVEARLPGTAGVPPVSFRKAAHGFAVDSVGGETSRSSVFGSTSSLVLPQNDRVSTV